MSATDALYFPPTGEETSHYVLVAVAPGTDGLSGRVSIEAPSVASKGGAAAPDYPGSREGRLADILKEAAEFAALGGYPLRVVKPAEVELPAELGTYAERKISG
ncbi:hypothetical protein GCM10011390_45910 [Aureimonas endophytica]|uniref:Uncharacterized protein n=1 Tax=Aureimonas endophytica TaxID=2027858 RepID=A0A917A0V8_9HYPH|nr:hypothetical protein [Aureimonas endophytica]GGE21384.1 hypothetical protein GCM10011390_45910 [Aureimonas endophytica]